MELLVQQLDRRVAEIGRWLEAEHGEPAEVRIIRQDSSARVRSSEYDDSSAPTLAPGGDWREALDTTVRLVRVDPGATQLHHDLRVLVDALKTLESDNPARPDLESLAETALLAIDWTCPGSPAFRASLARAHQLVDDGLRQLRTADYEPT